MPISTLDPWALIASGQPYTTTLELGTNWQPDDVRLYFLSTSTSRTITGITAGWSWLLASTTSGAASRTIAVAARVLRSGDTAPELTISSPSGPNVAHVGITLRGADTSAFTSWAPAAGGSTGSSRSVTAPSVATGAGLLLTAHWVTRTDNTANTGSWGVPSGMAALASSMSDGPMGYNVLGAAEQRSSGASGTRTATAASAGSWSALSLFVPEQSAPTGPSPGQFLPFMGR